MKNVIYIYIFFFWYLISNQRKLIQLRSNKIGRKQIVVREITSKRVFKMGESSY